MSKELTEEWKNDKLSGWYYCEREVLFNGNTAIIPMFLHKMRETEYRSLIKEVLAPVPSYEEYKDFEQDNRCLKSGIETYEKQLSRIFEQLKEANELLFDVLDCRESREYHAEKAEQYFKKYGVEK